MEHGRSCAAPNAYEHAELRLMAGRAANLSDWLCQMPIAIFSIDLLHSFGSPHIHGKAHFFQPAVATHNFAAEGPELHQRVAKVVYIY